MQIARQQATSTDELAQLLTEMVLVERDYLREDVVASLALRASARVPLRSRLGLGRFAATAAGRQVSDRLPIALAEVASDVESIRQAISLKLGASIALAA